MSRHYYDWKATIEEALQKAISEVKRAKDKDLDKDKGPLTTVTGYNCTMTRGYLEYRVMTTAGVSLSLAFSQARKVLRRAEKMIRGESRKLFLKLVVSGRRRMDELVEKLTALIRYGLKQIQSLSCGTDKPSRATRLFRGHRSWRANPMYC